MTPEDMDQILRRFVRLRPLRAFKIIFTSGEPLAVNHPEAVVRWGQLHVFGAPDRVHHFFSASTVLRVVLDPPPG